MHDAVAALLEVAKEHAADLRTSGLIRHRKRKLRF
jgi:hypothetical protein